MATANSAEHSHQQACASNLASFSAVNARRAIGEYAAEGGQVGEAGALVSGFFGALESFDFALFAAVRFERPVADNGRQLLDSAVAALDRCANLPVHAARCSRTILHHLTGRGCASCAPLMATACDEFVAPAWAWLQVMKHADVRALWLCDTVGGSSLP